MSKQKITKEEKGLIESLRRKYNETVVQVGEVETQILMLSLKKEKIKEELERLMREEDELTKQLMDKYGEDINSLFLSE